MVIFLVCFMVHSSRCWCTRWSAHGLLPCKVDRVDKAQVALLTIQIELQGKGVLVLQRDGVAGAVLPGKGGVPLLIGAEGYLRGALLIEQVGFLYVQLRVGGCSWRSGAAGCPRCRRLWAKSTSGRHPPGRSQNSPRRCRGRSLASCLPTTTGWCRSPSRPLPGRW